MSYIFFYLVLRSIFSSKIPIYSSIRALSDQILRELSFIRHLKGGTLRAARFVPRGWPLIGAVDRENNCEPRRNGHSATPSQSIQALQNHVHYYLYSKLLFELSMIWLYFDLVVTCNIDVKIIMIEVLYTSYLKKLIFYEK